MTLSWSNVANETGYEIGRSTFNTRKRTCGALGVIATTASEVTTTTDTRKSGTYCYAVRAFNASGVTGWSNVAQVTIAR